MKKILSITLALLLAMTALFSVSAFAEENRSEKFINDLLSTKTISAEIDDSYFGGLIKNVTLNVKLGDTLKISGSGKALGFLKVKIFGDGEKLEAYIGALGLFKVNISDIVGGTFEMDGITEFIDPIFEKADIIKKYITLDAANSTADCDKFIINKEAVKNDFIDQLDLTGTGLTKEDLKAKTFEELVAMAGQLGGEELSGEAEAYANLAKSELAFNYSGGKLVGVELKMYDENGNLTSMSSDELGLGFKSISTNVPDSAFNTPKFGIDITGLIKSVIGSLMG